MAEWTPAMAYLLRVTEREMREAWDDLRFYREAAAICTEEHLDLKLSGYPAKAAEKAAELRTLARVRRVLKGRTP